MRTWLTSLAVAWAQLSLVGAGVGFAQGDHAGGPAGQQSSFTRAQLTEQRVIDNDDPMRGIARFGPDAAPWVAAKIDRLAAMRSDNAEPRQVVLLGGDDEEGHLAVTWRGDDAWSVEIFVVDPSGEDGVRLRQVSTIKDELVQIVEPTGTRPFPGLPPVLAVAHSCMCSGGEGSVRIILLVGDTIDITPDWAGVTTAILDLDGDGTAEIVTVDESWHGFPDYCGACGPFVPVVLRRHEGRFGYACTELKGLYRDLIASLPPPPDPTFYQRDMFREVKHLRDVALLNAQIGAHAEALAAARGMVEVAAELLEASPVWNGQVYEVAHEIAELIDLAVRMDDHDGCPLSEISPALTFQPTWLGRWSYR